MACLSWPCFLESSKTCSLSKLQSPESLLIVTIATRSRDVDAKSDAYRSCHYRVENVTRDNITCLVCFSNAVSFSIAPCTFVCRKNAISLSQNNKTVIAKYQSQRLRLGKLFVDFLREVLVRLEDLGVGHGDGWGKEDDLALGNKEVPVGRAAGGSGS